MRRRPHNEVDRWDGRTYRRALALNGGPVTVEITQIGRLDTPRLHVAVAGDAPEGAVSSLTRQLLGLDVDLTAFYQLAAADEQLGPLASRFRGFKPPRYPS